MTHDPDPSPAKGSPRPPRRTGRSQLWLTAIVVLTLVGVTISAVVAGRTLTQEFETVEFSLARQRAEQLLQGLEADLRQLRINNRDYAHWDEAQQYVTTGFDRQFINTNFQYETLKNLALDTVWIGDTNGNEVYSGLVDRTHHTVIEPAPADLTAILRRLPLRAGAFLNGEPARTLLSVPQGTMAYSITQIARGDNSATTDYWLVFGRLIGADTVQRASDNSHLKIALHPVQTGAPGTPTGALPAGLRGILDDPTVSSSALVLGERVIQSVAVLRDAEGHPLQYLTSETPRDIASLGRKSTWQLLGIIVTLALLAGIGVLVMFHRLRTSFDRHSAAERRYRRIAAQLREMLLIVDAHTLIVTEMNQAMREALGIHAEEISHTSLNKLMPRLQLSELLENDSSSTTRRLTRETLLCRMDGTTLDVEYSLTPVRDGGQQLVCISARDISEKRRAEEQRRENQRKLIHIAHHDQLTKLPNRMYLHTKLPQVIRKVALREDCRLGLIYLDVDHFKKINDTYGHGCGDQLLQIVSSRLRACVQPQDVVVRMGGDEFVIIAPMIQGRAQLDELAQRVQIAMQAPMHVEQRDIATSTSMGIAMYPEDGRDMDLLLKHADIALYQAKEAGRRCHRFFSLDMNVGVSENLALEQALRHAIGTSQIFVEYQPVVDLATGKLLSLEALARWRHPEQGMVPPGQFIPVAEASGLIVDLGEQVLRLVAGQLRDWLDDGLPICPVAVNVSALQLQRTDFAKLAESVAYARGLEMKWLRFEITESALLKNPEQLIGTLQALRDLGSKVLIDDFGTGYSSLSYLHRLPVDTVKVDRSFVVELTRNAGSSPVIGAVVNMARKLGLNTVAEGIETAEQRSWLIELGCDMGQGYLFSRPVSAKHCANLFSNLGTERKLTETVMVRSMKTG